MSQGLGITKHPVSCSLRKLLRFSAMVGMARPLLRRLRRQPTGAIAATMSTQLSDPGGRVGCSQRCARATTKERGAQNHVREAAMPSFSDQAADRRKFLQFLAASPLLGAQAAFAGEGL